MYSSFFVINSISIAQISPHVREFKTVLDVLAFWSPLSLSLFKWWFRFVVIKKVCFHGWRLKSSSIWPILGMTSPKFNLRNYRFFWVSRAEWKPSLNSCILSPVSSGKACLRPRPHVSGDFCIRKFFYADTPSVHTCPPYTLGVSGDFCIRSPEWKFLYTLCIRIRVDARIRIFLYTLTSQYQNRS